MRHALLGPEGRDGQVVFVVGEGKVARPDLHAAEEREEKRKREGQK